MSVTPPPAPAGRFDGLDGMRALAVALVVAYHVFPGGPFVGGFLGVDVFFVISGFLITSLLTREKDATGRISLAGFWRRRARRLLPALVLVVVVCASIALAVGGDILTDLGRQVLGAATFSYNWLAVAAGGDYFAQTAPELFRNLWSLAVEEQFYVLWPLVLLLGVLIGRRAGRFAIGRRRAGIAVVMAAAVASAVWMAVLVASTPGDAAGGAGDAVTGGASGGAITRAYFGTDSHAFGLLLGAALALALPAVRASARPWVRRRATRGILLVAGSVAAAALVALALLPETATAWTFPGVLIAASALTGVVILACTWPGAVLGRALDIPSLRWIGVRSYAIYLWHWPIMVLLTASLARSGTGGADASMPWQLSVAALVFTLVAADLSLRLVETPVRRDGFRASIRRWGRALRGTAWRRAGAALGVVVTVALVAATSTAVAVAPTRSSAADAIAAGEAAVDAGTPTPGASAPAGADPAAATVSPVAPSVAATSPPIPGSQITAIGDSVMLASAPSLMATFPGISVDAKVSRSMYAAPGILSQLAADGELRPYIVIGLGTNGAISQNTLDEIVRIAGPDRAVVLVNAFAPRSWIPGVNDELRAFARQHPGVSLADWYDAISPHVDLLAGDQIHPGGAGGRIFAGAVEDGLSRADAERQQLKRLGALRELAGVLCAGACDLDNG
ncbi:MULTISPECIES: acyltransferase family protein [Microbacterium]|uniref:acyltransferase family protein n=1 Tax=Microbacterium TaxID=33882 RepID=UPI0010F93A6E|nr:acyltransferase family protein [Microbacterium sp. 4NA327F11]MCK9913184.1 acetyltransferase [Microbacteriaceae bacterium K1510]